MKKIWIVRHAQSRAQTEEEYGVDTGLSERGEKQAAALKRALQGIEFDKVFLSPLKRARETFELSLVKKKNIFFDSRLVEELPEGAYSYLLPYPELPSYGHPDRHNAWLKDVRTRAKSFLSDLYREQGRHFLVVSHAGFINSLLGAFIVRHEEAPLFEPAMKYCAVNNGGISVFLLGEPEKADSLLCWNDVRHIHHLIEIDPLRPFEDTPSGEQPFFEQLLKFFGGTAKK